VQECCLAKEVRQRERHPYRVQHDGHDERRYVEAADGRQHAAHEIGHTLGLSHNFIAASQGRASVMDYPVPIITVDAPAAAAMPVSSVRRDKCKEFGILSFSSAGIRLYERRNH